MATWNTWFPDLVIHARGAPGPLLRLAVCRAAREFCRRTRVWTEWLAEVSTTEGTGEEYSFVLPSESQIVRVERATLNGNNLPVLSFRDYEDDYATHSSGDKALVSRDLSSYILVGTFAADETVQAQVSLMPTLTATALPDHLANRYREAIAEGAKARVLITPGTDYYNEALAGVAAAKFEDAIGAVAVDAYRGHTNNVPRARPKWC